MHSQIFAALALGLTSPAEAQTQGNPDLVFSSLEIVDIQFVGNRYEIGIGYTISNIGGVGIDLAGPDANDSLDNIAIQTYMTLDPNLGGFVAAAGGGVITNPVFLNPGESYEGVFFSNNLNMPAPTDLDPGTWIVLDIVTSSVPNEINTNNRAFIQVPSPAGAGLLAAAGLITMTRRRR